ncbi:MAG: monovalent cation/H+ antiporter complex subunit F [Anaerolineae bacterium]
MSHAVLLVVNIALTILVLLLLPCAYRGLRGPTPADRLQAVEITTTLLIGIIVLLTIQQGSSLIIDVGIALAALAFIATLAIARYLSEGRVF